MKIMAWVLALSAWAGVCVSAPVRGVSLTEIGDHKYDAAEGDGAKSEAQQIVDKLYAQGVRHIELAPRAVMTHPRSSEVVPVTPPQERDNERRRYLRLARYIHSKGMTVGMRPIFFVVDGQGKTPYKEILPDGSEFSWWHGNILPKNVDRWFESFQMFLDIYLSIARIGKFEEFTLGAELYSMTVGIEDFAEKIPSLIRQQPDVQKTVDTLKYGMGEKWLNLLKYARPRLPAGCKIMYDINFTDDKVGGQDALDQFGGEFARWRYRIVELAKLNDPDQKKFWKALVDFWVGLDAVGIDLYRSLATKDQDLGTTPQDLITKLTERATSYASQIDNALFEIEDTVGKKKPVILKEIGFRSVRKGFIDPFAYADKNQDPFIPHQAAAYEAIFKAFWEAKWAWFDGIVFWDASVDKNLHGGNDPGFSFIDKDETQKVVQKYFKD